MIQTGVEYWCEATSENVEAVREDGDGYWLVSNENSKSYVVHESQLELPDWDRSTIMEREG